MAAGAGTDCGAAATGSTDGRSIYFTGQSGIWRLSLEPWLDAHKTMGD
ncbi:MAG TPA: hypothetical protein VJ722_05995 [Rhodanobacteraceae bacterium]|nr:hypothetical protein [Rhodanobacteraceae bacterium]